MTYLRSLKMRSRYFLHDIFSNTLCKIRTNNYLLSTSYLTDWRTCNLSQGNPPNSQRWFFDYQPRSSMIWTTSAQSDLLLISESLSDKQTSVKYSQTSVHRLKQSGNNFSSWKRYDYHAIRDTSAAQSLPRNKVQSINIDSGVCGNDWPSNSE